MPVEYTADDYVRDHKIDRANLERLLDRARLCRMELVRAIAEVEIAIGYDADELGTSKDELHFCGIAPLMIDLTTDDLIDRAMAHARLEQEEDDSDA